MLAEYLAEAQSLIRLDLRENDIRLGGIMALLIVRNFIIQKMKKPQIKKKKQRIKKLQTIMSIKML